MNKQQDSGNLIMAMVLCVAVIIGWQYFFVTPQIERQRQAAQTEQVQAPGAPATPGAPVAPGIAPPGAPLPREAVIASSGARVPFDNNKIDGSIRLTGGQIDDLRMKQYRETTDPKSPEIVFLAPKGSKGATYAEVGWTRAPGSTIAVPDSTTVWSTSSAKLTPATPVDLTWDNGQGLHFKRRIAVDDNYMFSVTDAVENRSG